MSVIFRERADDLLAYILQNSDKSPEHVSKMIEDVLRKMYWLGQLEGFKECKQEENERHMELRGKLLEAKEKIARNIPVWSDK